MRRNLLSLCLLAAASMLMFAEPAHSSDLSLFQRYFGTMDYSVTGTGKLRGSGKKDQVTGEYLTSKTISVDFPRNADLIAAFFYYQSHEISEKPSSARGFISYPSDSKSRVKFLAKPVGRTDLFDPCWNTGGTGGSTKDKALLRMYRADVLRYLEDPNTGKIPTQITFYVRDGGSGNGVTLVEGGSLVLIYRHPGLSFKSIVIYDGTGTMQTTPLTLDIRGFDQASPSPTDPTRKIGQAKITHGVGNGQANFSEKLFFNGQELATNPFQNGWDNITYDVSDKMGPFQPANTATPINMRQTKVEPFGKSDCLSWGFVVFSTTVEDTDLDGLLDFWEEYYVPDVENPAVPVMYLSNLGATRTRKDLLVEIDYMFDSNLSRAHSHRPSSKALQMVGDAFNAAPVENPEGAPSGINVIFDVGLQPLGGPYSLNHYVVGTEGGGGDRIDERLPAVFCAPEARPGCLFPDQPGTISWTRGFQHLKNTYFNDSRLGIFHYVIFGHQLAMREEKTPYLGKSNSGKAALPGDSVVVTLGRWRSSSAAVAYVGTDEQQAAVLTHELSHNLYGFHGGITLERPLTILDEIVTRPNCNNKQSSLNYLYLSAGLLDRDGVFRVNLSGEVLEAGTPGAQNESGLRETLGLAPGPDTPYRLRWYAPLTNVQKAFKTAIPLVAAARHCDGSTDTPVQPGMIRVDGLGVPGNPLARIPVDWNRDGVLTTLSSPLDINFNGKDDDSQDLRGFNDWKSIIDLHGLQQVGSGRAGRTGRNLEGLSLGVRLEDLLRSDESTLAEDDLAEDDLAEDDLAEDDLAEDDLAEDDLAEDDLAEDDLGDVSEIDEALAAAIGGNGPTALDSTLLNGPRRVLLTWSPPAFGGPVGRYFVYRAVDAGTYEEIGTWPTAATPQNPFVDNGNIQPQKTYRYVVIAEFVASPPEFPTVTLSTPSNETTETP